MARKKHLQDVCAEDMELIDASLRGSSAKDYNPTYANYDFKVAIKCKNQKQKEFLNALKNDDKQICIGVGAAGSGKSYISLAYALSMLKNSYGKYKNIVIVIPTALAGHPSMNIGFLPGTYEDKIQNFIAADNYTFEKILNDSGIYSAKQIVDGLVRNGVIRYEIVSYLRGRTFADSLILLNECENLNKDEMLLTLTRVGENSKLILTGDTRQCDRNDIVSKKSSGIEYAISKLGELDEVSITAFTKEDVVRNPLITKILDAWDD